MKRQHQFRRFAAFLLCLLAVLMIVPATASAETPYVTYTINGYGWIRQTQTAYLAHSTITKFGLEALSSPSDITIAPDGNLYIADSGNARIVVGTLDGDLVKTIGEGTLVNPRGVFVTENMHVYVADRDAQMVLSSTRTAGSSTPTASPTTPSTATR